MNVNSRIGSEARNIIESFQDQAPVNIIGIASGLGIKVWEDRLGDEISGKLFRDAKNGGASGYSIVVNAPEPLTRKRFTVAHEVAHFLLHRNQLDSDGVTDDTYYRSSLSNAMEAEANRLAADILMPTVLIDHLMAKGIKSVDGLASALKVSVPAMKIRIGIPVVD
jgi:Zn-dependent peptidase ImmA (M78 family)